MGELSGVSLVSALRLFRPPQSRVNPNKPLFTGNPHPDLFVKSPSLRFGSDDQAFTQELTAEQFMGALADAAGGMDPALEVQVPIFARMLVAVNPDRVMTPEAANAAMDGFRQAMLEVQSSEEPAPYLAAAAAMTLKYFLLDALPSEEIASFLPSANRLLGMSDPETFHEWVVQNKIEEKIPVTSADPLSKLTQLVEMQELKNEAAAETSGKKPKKTTKAKKKKGMTDNPDGEKPSGAVTVLTKLVSRFSPQISQILNWEKFHKLVLDKGADPVALEDTGRRLEGMLERGSDDFSLTHAYNQIFQSVSDPEWRLEASEILGSIYNNGGNPQFFSNLMVSNAAIKALTPQQLQHHFVAMGDVVSQRQAPEARNGLYTLINRLLNGNYFTVQKDLPFDMALSYSYDLAAQLTPAMGTKGWELVIEQFKKPQTEESIRKQVQDLKTLLGDVQDNPSLLAKLAGIYFNTNAETTEKAKQQAFSLKTLGIANFEKAAAWTQDFQSQDLSNRLKTILVEPYVQALLPCIGTIAEKVDTVDKLCTALEICRHFAEKGSNPMSFANFLVYQMPSGTNSIYSGIRSEYWTNYLPCADIYPKLTTPRQKALYDEFMIAVWREGKGDGIKASNYHQWVEQAIQLGDALPQTFSPQEISPLVVKFFNSKGLQTDLPKTLEQFKYLTIELAGAPVPLSKWILEKTLLSSYPERTLFMASLLRSASEQGLSQEILDKLFQQFALMTDKINNTDAQKMLLKTHWHDLAKAIKAVPAQPGATSNGTPKPLEVFSDVWNQLYRSYNGDEALKMLGDELVKPSIPKELMEKLTFRYSESKLNLVMRATKAYVARGLDPKPLVAFLTEGHPRYNEPYAVSYLDTYLKPFLNIDKFPTPAHWELVLPVFISLFYGGYASTENWETRVNSLVNIIAALPESLSASQKQKLRDTLLSRYNSSVPPDTMSEDLKSVFATVSSDTALTGVLADQLVSKPELLYDLPLLETIIDIFKAQGVPPQEVTSQLADLAAMMVQMRSLVPADTLKTVAKDLFAIPVPSLKKALTAFHWIKSNLRLSENIFNAQYPWITQFSLLASLDNPDRFLDTYMLNFAQVHPSVMLGLLRYLSETSEGFAQGKNLLPELMAVVGPYTSSLSGKDLDVQSYSAQIIKTLAKLKEVSLSNIEPLEYDNYARLGVLSLSYPKWKFDAMTRWKGQGDMERPALLAQSGQFRKIPARPDDKTYHGGYHRYDKKTGVSIELRRAYAVISKPGLGTLVVRNSGTQFGRDLLPEVAYYHPTRTYTSGQDLFYPGQDLTETYQGEKFQSVLSNELQQSSRKKPSHENIKALLDELDKGMVPYLAWKYGFKQGKPAEGIKELINASLLSARNMGNETPFGTTQNIQLAWVNRFGVPYPVQVFDVKDPKNLAELEFFDKVLNKEDRALSAVEYQERMPNLMQFLTFGLENKLELVLSE